MVQHNNYVNFELLHTVNYEDCLMNDLPSNFQQTASDYIIHCSV